MAGHTSEKRWSEHTVNGDRIPGVSSRASEAVNTLINTLNGIEEAYQQMQEIYTYAGGTDALLAELLFKETIAARSSPDNVASTEEIDKAGDLIAAMIAAHQIYQAANNVAVAQADRFTDLRRMA
jgi:hypothetical protein